MEILWTIAAVMTIRAHYGRRGSRVRSRFRVAGGLAPSQITQRNDEIIPTITKSKFVGS